MQDRGGVETLVPSIGFAYHKSYSWLHTEQLLVIFNKKKSVVCFLSTIEHIADNVDRVIPKKVTNIITIIYLFPWVSMPSESKLGFVVTLDFTILRPFLIMQSDWSVENGLFRLKPKSGLSYAVALTEAQIRAFLRSRKKAFFDSTFFDWQFRLADPVEKLDFFDWIQ